MPSGASICKDASLGLFSSFSCTGSPRATQSKIAIQKVGRRKSPPEDPNCRRLPQLRIGGQLPANANRVLQASCKIQGLVLSGGNRLTVRFMTQLHCSRQQWEWRQRSPDYARSICCAVPSRDRGPLVRRHCLLIHSQVDAGGFARRSFKWGSLLSTPFMSSCGGARQDLPSRLATKRACLGGRIGHRVGLQ